MGIVGVENGRLNIAAALDPAVVRAVGGPAGAVRDILVSARIAVAGDLSALDWQGTMPLTQQLVTPAGRRVFVLGDAAGYVEPFTGEGMAWALAAAHAAVPWVRRVIERAWDPAIERGWAETHRIVTGRQQRFCRIVARALRRPALVSAAVALVSRAPALAAPLVSRLSSSTLYPPKRVSP